MKTDFFHTLAALPDGLFDGDSVFLRLIRNEEDLAYAIFDCHLREEQKELVNPASFSIGRAYLHPAENYPCVICAEDGRRIGFMNLLRWLGAGEHVSWSYYLDEREQGKGYGKAAARLAIRILKAAFPEQRIKLSTEECNRRAQDLYASLGFQLLEERDGDDLVFGL